MKKLSFMLAIILAGTLGMITVTQARGYSQGGAYAPYHRLDSPRQIARMEHRFVRDGYYSPRERRIVRRALDRSRHHMKHRDHGNHYGRHHRPWHGHSYRHGIDQYGYEESDDSYVVGRSSSTTVSAEVDGLSVSWATSDQE